MSQSAPGSHSPDSARRFARSRGGVLPIAAFRRAGLTDAALRESAASGTLLRVRRGWYADPGAPAPVVRAARVGGALTGASVARLHGLWLLHDSRLHVRVPATMGRLRHPDDASRPLDRSDDRICIHHRTAPAHPDDLPARDGLARALAEMYRCSGELAATVALESALRLGELDAEGHRRVGALVPAVARGVVESARSDADSGLETIARMLLRSRRIRHRVQHPIPGVGRVDILVGDRLVIELDGEAFHSGFEFEEDRRRDFELIMRGYLVLRISYRMLLHDRDRVSRGILAVVGRGEHRWAGARREYPAFV